jgi:DNA end-binding protein Ku
VPGQSIWSGTISFSLVAIPVQLVKATEPGKVSFRMLHNKDYSPLLRKMFCPVENVIVPPEEIVRGYEIGPDKYVIVTEEELDSVSPERSRTIEIIQFIDIEDVDPIYYDNPYYLTPSKGGEKAFRLLVEVMRRTGKAGVAKLVLSEREDLVVIRSVNDVLSLVTLHYTDEILSDEDILPKATGSNSNEESQIKKIIKAMTAEFNPNKYANERRKKVVALLEKKAKEKIPVEAPEFPEEEEESVVDLVAALEESMRKIKESK